MMYWSILFSFGVLSQGFLTAAFPADIGGESKKAAAKEKFDPTAQGGNSDQTIEQALGYSRYSKESTKAAAKEKSASAQGGYSDQIMDNTAQGGPPQPVASVDSNQSEDKNLDDALPPNVNKKCPGVACSKPPNDAVCQTSTEQNLNVMAPIMGELSDCCPFYLCTRGDGSFFTHFGMSTSNPSGSTQAAAVSTSFSTSSSSGYGYGGLSSFNTQNTQPQGLGQGYNLPTSNSFMTASNFGSSSNYGPPNGFVAVVPSYGQPIVNQLRTGDAPNFSRHVVIPSNSNNRYGNSNNGIQTPTYPTLPFMPVLTFQAPTPVFTNTVFPNWMRDRRDARPAPFGQPMGYAQPQNFRPQGNQNIFHGMGHQQQQTQGQYF